MKKYTRGFTLIELLVVIAIIGILSSVVLVSLNSARTKGKDVRVVTAIQQIRTQIEADYNGSNYSGSFTGANTLSTSGNYDTLVDDITANSGTFTAVTTGTHPAISAYAIYGGLPSSGTTPTRWFCIDSTGKTNQQNTDSTGTTCD